MPHRPSSTRLPAKALREYRKIADSDWGTGVPLTELLKRINRVAEHLAPEEDGDGRDSRVKRVFSARSLRHYQTLGCIDPPEKEGRRTAYGFRHFVQALLVRRLLLERMPSEQIAVVMAGRGTEEMERMFLGGIEVVARDGAGEGNQECGPDAVAIWKCVRVSPGVELHMSCDLPKQKPAALKKLLADLEAALRRNL